MKLNKEQIKDIIPHREPFLLLDKVNDVKFGEYCEAELDVTKDMFWVKGHFPEFPVMPGVLIVEALAQAGAVAILGVEENKGKIAFFGGMKNVRFKNKVVPGDKLILKTTLVRLRYPIGTGDAVAYVNDVPVATCSLTFFIGNDE